MTLRFTSPQAAMESISAAFMRLHGRLQIVLDHAVQLERLARGQAQRSVAVGAREARQRQPLLRA